MVSAKLVNCLNNEYIDSIDNEKNSTWNIKPRILEQQEQVETGQ